MKTCDFCSCEVPTGTGQEVLDENYNKTGSYECDECWNKEIQSKYSDEE